MAMASTGLKSSSSPFSVFVVVFLSLCCCFVLCDEGITASPRKTVNDNVYSVGVPVTNLRILPKAAIVDYEYDALQDTQLLYNEPVRVLQQEGDWSLVECLQQNTFVNNTLGPYKGWIQSNDLLPYSTYPSYSVVVTASNFVPLYARPCHNFGCLPTDALTMVGLGTIVQVVEENRGWLTVLSPGSNGTVYGYLLSAHATPLQELETMKKSDLALFRRRVVDTSKTLLGVYYFWGGRSAFSADLFTSNTMLTGTDCSGLVSLSYRANGILLPRNSGDIFKISTNITDGAQSLLEGDCLFFSDGDQPYNIIHVMMVAEVKENSADTLIVEQNWDSAGAHEGHVTNGSRLITAAEKYGCSMADLRWNQPVPIGGYRIYWGRVIDYVSPTTLTTTAITTTTTTTATSPQQQPTADVGYHELTNRLNL